MSKLDLEDLENLAFETLVFDTVDEAFEDYCYDYSKAEMLELLNNGTTKEDVLNSSPSYIFLNNKWYFNGEFADLSQEDINSIINLIG